MEAYSRRRELNAKSMGLSEVRAIVLDQIDVDSILLDPAVSEPFYLKHDVVVSLSILTFYWQH